MRYNLMPLMLLLLLLAGCAAMQESPSTTVTAAGSEAPVILPAETHQLKKIIAVGRFTNDTRLASSFLTEGSDNAAKLSRAATDVLSAKLVQSGQFLVIERFDSLAINAEQSISNIESYHIPADYLILGSISEFGRNVTGNVGLIDRTKKQTAFAKVYLRLVDTRNGMVIFAQEGSGEAVTESETVLGMGSQAGYDDTLTDKAIDAAIGSVIHNLIRTLERDPWKAQFLSLEDNDAFISGGALQGIRSGDEFYVYEKGKTVMDTRTNQPIQLPGKRVARIRIKEVIPGSELTELSVARFIEGNIAVDRLQDYYISDK